ncbi:MAG: hypothetical protein JSV80_18310 [Acidobacteriota bacterium]|nr:MAG: hypothetical protein JSV80_18310 [Acidobacteriota bacterium]
MVRDHPTWGAPREHGELMKLGFEISETTVTRYMPAPISGSRDSAALENLPREPP